MAPTKIKKGSVKAPEPPQSLIKIQADYQLVCKKLLMELFAKHAGVVYEMNKKGKLIRVKDKEVINVMNRCHTYAGFWQNEFSGRNHPTPQPSMNFNQDEQDHLDQR